MVLYSLLIHSSHNIWLTFLRANTTTLLLGNFEKFLECTRLVTRPSSTFQRMCGSLPSSLVRREEDEEGSRSRKCVSNVFYLLGAALAFLLSPKPVSDNKRSLSSSLLAHVYLVLAFAALLLPTLPPSPTPPPMAVQQVITAIVHFLPALSGFYILYVSLVPPSHRFAIIWLRWFLSLPLWYPLSQLSFGVFMVHWRIMLHVWFVLLRPPSTVIGHALIWKAIALTFFASYAISVPLFLFVEQPIWNAVRRFVCKETKKEV